MNEKKWQKCLTALSDIDENWADKIVKNKRIENNELGQKVIEFLTILKDMAKLENRLPEEVEEALKSNSDLLGWIESWLGNALQGYRGFAPIRNLAEEDEEIVRNLLRASFDNYVLRFDPRFYERFATYRLKEGEMIKVLQLLESLTDYYVMNHMTKNAIREDFERETGLNDDLCDFYAGLIEENYQLLLMNYIAESFAEIRREKNASTSGEE